MRRDSEIDVDALAQQLARLQRRAARQKRKVGSSPEAWQRWSATTDEIASLTQRLVASPAPDLEHLAVKFSAILWLIEVNESFDSGDLRRLRRFGRNLSALADQPSALMDISRPDPIHH
jgi:hypothetical protein